VSKPQAILSAKYMSVGVAGGVTRAAGALGRYVQYRDNKNPNEQVRDVDGLARYVSYRDRASPDGRLFDANGTIGDEERRDFTRYVSRSVAEETRSYRAGDPRAGRQRAMYRFVLSPADGRDVDLRQLTRNTMGQLAKDVGTQDLRWIAAEHRNTAHPHVHILMAAKREVRPKQYRTVQLTRPRLERMKTAIDQNLTLQRSTRAAGRQKLGRTLQGSSQLLSETRATKTMAPDRHREIMNDLREAAGLPRRESAEHRRERRGRISSRIGRVGARLANHYRQEMERAVREEKWSSEHDWDHDRLRDRGRGRGRGE
jgi:hypothetical protein